MTQDEAIEWINSGATPKMVERLIYEVDLKDWSFVFFHETGFRGVGKRVVQQLAERWGISVEGVE